MIAKPVHDMPTRMSRIEASLEAMLTDRHIERSHLLDYQDYGAQALADGVVVLVSAGEGGYRRAPGMIAKEGTQELLLIGYIKAAPDARPVEVESKELALIEEIKAWARAAQLDGIGLWVERIEHSRQTAAPYGWIVVHLQAGPPNANIS